MKSYTSTGKPKKAWVSTSIPDEAWCSINGKGWATNGHILIRGDVGGELTFERTLTWAWIAPDDTSYGVAYNEVKTLASKAKIDLSERAQIVHVDMVTNLLGNVPPTAFGRPHPGAFDRAYLPVLRLGDVVCLYGGKTDMAYVLDPETKEVIGAVAPVMWPTKKSDKFDDQGKPWYVTVDGVEIR